MKPRTQAQKFLDSLPQDQEGPERSRASRSLIFESRSSVDARELVRAVYSLLAEEETYHSLHDLHMFLASLGPHSVS